MRAFALVDRETIADEHDPAMTTETIRVHRLVRTVAAAGRQGEDAAEAARVLIEAMAAVYSRNVFSDPASWPRARRLDALALDLVDGAAAPPERAEMTASYLLDRRGKACTRGLCTSPAGCSSARWRSERKRLAPSIPIPAPRSTISRHC